MSAASKAARAAQRASQRTEPEIDVMVDEAANHRAVALVPDSGGFRLITLSLPPSVLEAHAVSVSETEVAAIQLALAHRALDEATRGELNGENQITRPACAECGVPALVRHPSKPVDICCACNARFEVSA